MSFEILLMWISHTSLLKYKCVFSVNVISHSRAYSFFFLKNIFGKALLLDSVWKYIYLVRIDNRVYRNHNKLSFTSLSLQGGDIITGLASKENKRETIKRPAERAGS